VGAFDNNPERIGKKIHGVPIFSIDTLNEQVRNLNASIAILTVPSTYAQESADRVVNAGIKAIWNFTNTKLKLPSDVVCQREDLTSGYAMLCVMMNENQPKLVKE
jgi:redox-sensing transcriptional repressor